MSEGAPGGMNFLQAKMLQPVDTAHEAVEPTLEQKKIEEGLRAFFAEKKYIDSKGKQVTLDQVYWPTEKDTAAYKEVLPIIENDEFKEYFLSHDHEEFEYEFLKERLLGMAHYFNEAATFDSLKDKYDHTLRRKIERDLEALSREDPKKYKELHSTYYDNRLSFRHIRNPIEVTDLFFKSDDFSPELQKQHMELAELSEIIETDRDRDYNWQPANRFKIKSSRYETLDDAGKLEATKMTAEYILNFFREIKQLSHEIRTQNNEGV